MKTIRGFTLVELLVAIVVMSMLALLSWRSLDGMTRTQTITQQRADDLLRMQAAMGQWAADLDAVTDTGEVNALDFNGQVLRMTRRDSGDSGHRLARRGLVLGAILAVNPAAEHRAARDCRNRHGDAARKRRARQCQQGHQN